MSEAKVDIKEAAEILGCTQQFLRVALQQNKFPFGNAIKTSSEYTYYINRGRLMAWMKGEL
ncbi:MAG: hypothetical protein IJ439_03760 [Tyzzerella sp.]|nr:hypothetical protein [Tyzzerella sp.]